MQAFMLLFLGLPAQPDAADATTQAFNDKWRTWVGGLAQSGVLQSGAPFEPRGLTVSRDGSEPLELQPVDFGGYLIVNAELLDAAAELAAQAPHTELGGRTVVRPCVTMGG
jgi:hypothetical protein